MNKSVLITGAVKNTGFCIAERFAKEGYDVFITSRDEKQAVEAAKKISEKYGVFSKGYGLPSGDEQLVINVFEDIKKMGYLLNTLVLNAANLGINQDVLTVDYKEFMDVFNTNIGWNFMLVRQACLQMKENGGGAVVFVTSNTAYRAIPNRVAYGASKSGIIGMARGLSLDLGKYNIRFNCVLPGMIKTDRWYSNTNNIQGAPSRYTPLGDIATYEDIANGVWYLGSDQSRNVTGEELVIDGGNMVQLYPIIPENK